MDSLNRLLGKPTVVNEQNKWEDNPGRTSQISLSASNIGNDKVDSIVAANLIIEMPPIENKDGNNGDVDGNSNNNNSARNTGESLGSRKNSILLDKSGQKQLHKSIEDRHYEGTPESTMELLDFYVYTEEFLTQTLVLGVKIGVKVPDKIPQKLVKLGANINFVDPITKKSPLMIAICNYDSKMALLLLSLGAKYELVDKFKSDAITYAIYYGLPTVVDAIMDKITGGDHDGTKGHDAYKKFAHTFLKRGKPSPLVYAIQQKREAIALKLIDFGADIYSTAPVTDEPAIYTAVDNKLLKVVDSMLGHHIDLKSENEKGFYPLHCAIDNSYHLGSGSVDEDYVTLSKKLIEYGAPINAASGLKLFDGATPLIVAAKNKNTVITEILLEKGAQLGIKDKVCILI